ncbi:hypothetical protein [Aliikangiella sp. IMCC44359]|uniref:hypothetical protein n=1 Tax=Aliikangiella sp. IMCC44359 TaxID=3459125 RepID=UPI00403AD6DD
MKKFGLLLSIIVSFAIGYYISLLQESLKKANQGEDIIAEEIALLEKFKIDIPCSVLKESAYQLTGQNSNNGFIIWRYKQNDKAIRKLVVDEDLNIAEESLINTCD